MNKYKHRTGSGYELKAPTGLMEHSKNGPQMEKAFDSKLVNNIIDFMIGVSTNDNILSINRKFLKRGDKLGFIQKQIDNMVEPTNGLFEDVQGAKEAFLGKKNAHKYKSVFGGYFLEFMTRYADDWEYRQKNKIVVPPPKRLLKPLKKTYSGWKKLRDELQPGWEVFPKDPSENIKIFENDSMSPYERVENIIKGKG
ncbi:MAG: hypothetical protein GY870_16865, partial [archaeon]|nr:hypothetical protein [archaeon]